jgi:RNA recognition motif-containing protein
MSTLFLVNIPHDCSDAELTAWVESSGVVVKKIRMIRDLVAEVSPSFAYVELGAQSNVVDAVRKLNGHSIRKRAISVSEARRGATAA